MPNTSSLDVLHDAFESLIDGPCPYSIDGRTIDGLPDRPVPAGELRDLLPHLDGYVRDEIWRELVRRARTRSEAWTVIAAGLALPGLRTAARVLNQTYRGDREDMDAEVLAGFLAGLATMDPVAPYVCRRLRAEAYNAGRRLRWADDAYAAHHTALPACDQYEQRAEPVTTEVDLLLAQAVRTGRITAIQARLIELVHMQGRSIVTAARMTGIPKGTARESLHRATGNLAGWLTCEDIPA
ncbi:MAG TPA: hypothetical protein VNW94_07095 [Streptosporangiaceae bacterium]|nr:hypothetical protein [Streptosporangiaceae bacterium]